MNVTNPVASLTSARLLRDMEALDQAEAKVAALKARVTAGCKAWSYERGYRVPVRPELVRAAIQRESEG